MTAQEIALPYFAPLMPTIMSGAHFVIPDEACSVLALNRVPESDRPAIHARLTPESGLVYQALLTGAIAIDPTAIQVPVFVAGGEEDRIIAPEQVRHTAQHYGVEPRLYPNHGHWIIDEPGTDAAASDDVAGISG